MWLYVPPEALPSESSQPSAGWEDSTSESSELSQPELFVTSSGKPTARQLSWRGWKTRPWIELLSGIRSSPSMASRGVEKWISSLGDFHAKISHRPVTEQASRERSPAFSLISPASLARFDPDTSSWKTSQRSLFGDSIPFSARFPNSGTTSHGWLHPHKRSALPICASAGFALEFFETSRENTPPSWKTPKASDPDRGSEPQINRDRRGAGGEGLKSQVEKWPTPTTTDAASSARGTTGTGVMNPGTSLTDKIRESSWPTPAARDHKGFDAPGKTNPRIPKEPYERVAGYPTPKAVRYGSSQNGVNSNRPSAGTPSLDTMASKGVLPSLPGQESEKSGSESSSAGPSSSQPSQEPRSLTLNPSFVEWLMGFPRGFSKPIAIAQQPSEPSGTPSSPNRQKQP